MNIKSLRPAVILLALAAAPAYAQNVVSLWLTNADGSARFQRQSAPIPFGSSTSTSQTIEIDPHKTYQSVDGFGFALTGGSAQLIMRMDSASRAALLQNLFADDGDNIGVSYLRLSIGASDMNDHVYSYDDVPKGETDPTLAHFSIDPDKADVIPVLKQILAINPKIKILASPWSAPLWMKTNDAAQGGVLKPEYFSAYANYFVKYIQAMQAEGITIDAVTIQNEPLNEKNTPSMLMISPEQDEFIKHDLGPAFQKAGIKTRIVLYDHNLDHPLYALAILRDPAAAKYVDGTGFHLYGGSVDAMTQVHDEFPNKNIYFTEQSVTDRTPTESVNLSRPMAWVMIGVMRNWSRNVLLWNLAADPNFGPHTNNGGCTMCAGALTIDGNQVKRNVAYYVVAHASKFVRPGSVRIDSSTSQALPNVAFLTPDKKIVLLVSNPGDSAQQFTVRIGSKSFSSSLNAGSVGTYVW